MEVEVGFEAELWEWESRASWFFVTVPPDESDDIREMSPDDRGFGSVRVDVEVGESRWRTSVFPDSKLGCYVLPVKKAVRVAEGIEPGDRVGVVLRVLLE
jgi:Domain of unknown function (DUF1905)